MGTRKVTVRREWLLAVVVVALGVAVVSWRGDEAQAHGSTQMPPSRVYACRFSQPDNPMCSAAWDANAQALYDWMEVNIADADGRHRDIIPDGKLCSAGRDKYAALDSPGDWPLTQLRPNAAGLYDITFTSTAPHATASYQLLITRAGFDARRDPLRWADLEPVYDSGPLPANTQNHFAVALPERQEPAILYVIWQRSDSPEAFYACSDVTVGAGGAPPLPPPPTTPGPTTPTTAPAPAPSPDPTPSPSPSPSPTTAPTTPPPSGEDPWSPVAGVVTTLTTTASWDAGRCVEIRVENTGATSTSWEVHYTPGGEIASLWNAAGEEQQHDGHEGHTAFTGEDWNERLTPGKWTTFGMCIDG